MARWISLYLMCAVTDCASVRTTGSFVERPAPATMRLLAADAAHQLGLLYPPTHTQLAFAHATADAFGQPFVAELRSLGFAIADPAARGSQLRIAYVLDELDPLYRVVLRVATAHRRLTLARAYTHRGDTPHAAGAWTEQVLP